MENVTNNEQKVKLRHRHPVVFRGRVIIEVAAIISLLMFASCAKSADYFDDGISDLEFVNDCEAMQNSMQEDYVYPDNPVEELKNHLENDNKKRGLSLHIGGIEELSGNGAPQKVFSVDFTNSDDNTCVFSFAMNEYYSLDGKDNPSFTMAFKDPENSQDMKTILTSVIEYISPELSFDEAQRIAWNQDKTISTDGYSMPKDIGGYQIQTIYTYPHILFKTREYDSVMGVTITALKQIWGKQNTENATELAQQQDFYVLTSLYPHEGTVYGDFIVKGVWQHEEPLHGDYWRTITVESMTGQQYTLRLETMRMLMDYEFGVGQKYTMFISTSSFAGPKIYYAAQRTESDQFNSRGKPQPIEYITEDLRNEENPDYDGTVNDVIFLLNRNMFGPFAVTEGHGVGDVRWLNHLERDGYKFIGWYNNPEGSGEPYTKDTPIFENTELYAMWKYTGQGGYWPRNGYGIVNGISMGDNIYIGQTVSITAEGYNMNLEKPNDQRFRWKPASWKVSDRISGMFPMEAPFHAEFSIESQGEYTLFISYTEEIFDGLTWQPTGQVCEVEELSFTAG